MKSTTRPQENLVVGLGKCYFLPEDHKILNLGGKIFFIFVFESTTRPNLNEIHHKTTRKSCGGGGFGNMSIFTRRPQDL